MAKTPKEKLAELESAKSKIQARIQAEKSKLRSKERKDETRLKIIVGSVVLAHSEHDEGFKDLLWTILKNRTTRETDRSFLGLPKYEKTD